ELESLLKQTNRLAKVGSWELIIRDNKDDSMYWSDITREILEVGDNYNPTLTGGFEFYTEESMAIIQQAVENAIHKGLPFDEELKLISAKGNTRYVRCIGDAVFVDGKCERIYGSFQDITDKKTAEIELQKAFKEKNTILESIGDAFFAVDHNWTITYWNREAEALLDKPREDIIGKNLWEEYEDAVELEFYSQYHKAVEEQVRVDFEEYYPGAEKWFDVSAYPSETGLSVFFHDITEKKQANQKIQETNEKLKTAQQIAKLGYWELNLETKETFWSEQSYKIWEFDPNISITQELIFERMHPDDVDFFMEQHQNMLETNSPLELEHRIILPNGNIKWIRVKGDLYKSDTGEPKYVEGTAQDITGQKEAELELDEALKQKENILESIGDAFYAVDKNWTVTYWNREAERLMQTPRSEIVDNNVWDVFPEATEMKTYTYLHRAMHENKTIDFEDFYPPLEKWLNISAYPSPDGVSVFFKDITESKKAREELEKLNTKLQQRAQELAASNAELEQFAYVASHDLQEPLRMVTSFLTQLEKKYGDKLDDKATEYINFAVDGAQRMRQIILDLLNYSRLNQDKNTLEKVDLNKVLKEVQSLERSHIEESGAEIIIPELPVIMANPGPIKQVFKNLLNNALKYHNSGTTPKVELLVEEQESHWKFSVKDNGIGINPEFQENIFQIFQRLHTRDQYSGTGIGLAISKKIIERHGGEIWVESEEGKGSTFVFTIEK
ncbi:MAG: PAS domain S-box protein, partial [Balneolaceae bacterium]